MTLFEPARMIPMPLTEVSISESEGNIYIVDDLSLDSFVVNQSTLEIIELFNGVYNLKKISEIIANRHNLPVNVVERDVIDLYKTLNRAKLIISRRTLKYYYIKLYYALLRAITKEARL